MEHATETHTITGYARRRMKANSELWAVLSAESGT
jgi:hypothetical protein